MEQIRGLNTHGDAIIGTGVVFTVCSVAAVGLRFVSKRITRSPIGVDDWLLLASLAFFFASEVLVIRGDIIGRQATSEDDERYKTYLRYVYVYSAFTFPIVAFAQMSLLFLYRRVFYPTHMRYTTLVLVGIVFAWLVASSTIEIGYPGHTIGAYFPGGAETVFHVTYLSFWLAMAIIETLIEIVIMILPINEIRRLKLSNRQKMGLFFIFSLGGFVVITNIIRMSILYRPKEPEFDLTAGNILLNVHFGTAIISACLPTYKPLITRSASVVSNVYASNGAYRKGSRISEDTRGLRSDKEKVSSPHSRQLKEEISMDEIGRTRCFAEARRSESHDTSKREWEVQGAVQAGEAIGVKKTIEIV